ENLAGEIPLPLELSLEVLDLRDVEEDAAVLQNLALSVADHEGILKCVDHASVATAQGDLKIADRAFLVKLSADFITLLAGDVDLVLQVELQDFFARLITQHAHQRVIHLDEVPFGRRKKDAFLHVVEELAVTSLGLAPIGNVFEDVDGLQ